MLTIIVNPVFYILDIVGGYLIARHVSNIWLAVLAALLVGVVSAVGGGFLIHAWAPDLFGWGDTFLGITQGIMFHPIVAVVSLLIFRRKKKTDVT